MIVSQKPQNPQEEPMNQIDTTFSENATISNRKGARLLITGIIHIPDHRKKCSSSKCNTVIIAKILTGYVEVCDDLSLKNSNGQIITERICSLEINGMQHTDATSPNEVGILLEKIDSISLQQFLECYKNSKEA